MQIYFESLHGIPCYNTIKAYMATPTMYFAKGLVASHTMRYQKPYMASHECKDNNICNIPSMFDIIVFQLLWSLDTQCYYHCIYMIFQPTRNVYDMIIFWFKHQ